MTVEDRQLLKRSAAACLAVLLLTTPLPASVVVPMTLAEMSLEAQVIVDAQVVAIHVTEDTGRIERVVTLRVLERWKGSVEGVVHVRLPGGVLGRTQTVVPGVPVMRTAERFVLFLADEPGGAFRVLGLHQGAWRVTASPLDGSWQVGPAPSSHVGSGRVQRGDGARRVRSIHVFRHTVGTLVTQAP